MTLFDGPSGPVVLAFASPAAPYQMASLPVDHSPGDQWLVKPVDFLARYNLDFGGKRLGQIHDDGNYYWWVIFTIDVCIEIFDELQMKYITYENHVFITMKIALTFVDVPRSSPQRRNETLARSLHIP